MVISLAVDAKELDAEVSRAMAPISVRSEVTETWFLGAANCGGRCILRVSRTGQVRERLHRAISGAYAVGQLTGFQAEELAWPLVDLHDVYCSAGEKQAVDLEA